MAGWSASVNGALLAGALAFAWPSALCAAGADVAVEAAAPQKTLAVATGARLAGDEKRTRLVVDLTEKVDFHVFSLADPARVVIDLPQMHFLLDEAKAGEGRGLVLAYRYGQFAPGKCRIVIDAAGPVRVDKAFVLDAQEGQPARFVLDLVGTDERSFQAEIALQSKMRASERRSRPEADPLAPIVEEGSQRPVVVIDPGHGGIDPGATSPGGTREKDIVLAVSRKIKEALDESGRFEVLLTRNDDVFLPLGERVRFAREKGAALFLSIHADSVRRGRVSGATVYTLSERASDQMAADVAAKENMSDAIAGVELPEEVDAVADILLDLVQRETKTLSIHFARNLVEGLRRKVDMVRNPHRHAGFKVLKAHDVPSVLIELGYLSSRDDERLLRDTKWQGEVSGQVARVVERFFGDRQARSPF